MSQAEHTSGISSRPAIGILGGIGMLLLGLASLLFAVSFASRTLGPKPPSLSSDTPLAASTLEPGFGIVQLGTFRRDQFLVDKKTGRIWKKVCMGNVAGADCSGLSMWDEMYVSGITPDSSAAAWEYNAAVKAQTAAPSR